MTDGCSGVPDGAYFYFGDGHARQGEGEVNGTGLETSMDVILKIDVVKGRLIRNYGYDEESATDVLNFVASIFARGDVKDNG